MVVGLISLSSAKWLFAGLYQVNGWKNGRPGKPNGFTYETKRITGLEHLEGRAIVYFKRDFRQSYLRGERFGKDLAIDSILPARMTLGEFPGFNDILLAFPMLRVLMREENTSWKAALANVGGIYVIVDSKTGKQYVGSASGGIGIWHRWSQYAKSGHGGNKELKKLLGERPTGYVDHFQVALLEVCDLEAGGNYIVERECFWKKVLLTREFGLNAN